MREPPWLERLKVVAERAAEGERQAAAGTFIRRPWRGPDPESAQPRRLWWKKRRWAAALVVCLLIVAGPLNAPPVMYLAMRGWLPKTAYHWAYTYYNFVDDALGETSLHGLYRDYFAWWFPIISCG